MFARIIHNYAPLYVIAPSNSNSSSSREDHFPLKLIYPRRERKKRVSLAFIQRNNRRRRSRSMQFSGRFVIADASGHFVYEQFARTPPDPPSPLYLYLCLCDPTPPKSHEHSFNSHLSRAVPPRWSADVNTSRLPLQDQVIYNLSSHQRVWVSYLPWSR